MTLAHRMELQPTVKKKWKCRQSFYVANDRFSIGPNGVNLPMAGAVATREHLRFHGEVQGAVVSREADRGFISVMVAGARPDSDIPSRSPVGVDLGLKPFAKLSTGESIAAPKPLKKAQARLRRLNRRLARTDRASNSHRNAVRRLARQRRRVRDTRQDFLHRFTAKLTMGRSEIYIEDLNVSGMAKNQSLAVHICDAAWGEARRQLEYKTVLYRSKLTVRDRFYASSRLCSACGWKDELLKLSDRKRTRPNCGCVHDQDHNAAMNLLPVPQAMREFTPLKIAALTSGKTGGETAVVQRGTLPCARIHAQER